MLSVDFWLEHFDSQPLTPAIIKSIQQDALSSCRVIAGQKWRKNENGQWRYACLSIIKAIKVLEGEQEVENEED